MKRVVSVSLGSSKRDHRVELELLREEFCVERIGTDGDFKKAIALIKELDGKVDAFGMGGIDLYIYAGDKRYTLKEAEKIANAAVKTPIVDGSGLKNTLERRVISYLQENKIVDFSKHKVLMVSAVDRFGMAQSLDKIGCEITYGDLIFGLGLPIPLRSLSTLEKLAHVIIPIISRIPFKFLYPTGGKQEKGQEKHSRYYQNADVIAGDFHFIKRYMPANLKDKIIITNTVTTEDVQVLKSRGVKKLITTTPELEGRSFGTNVMEGILISLIGKPPEKVDAKEYDKILDKLDFRPRIVELNKATSA